MKKIFGILFLGLTVVLCGACLFFGGNISINNVWKVSDTNLQITVTAANQANGEVERQMRLSENYSDKKKISLARGAKDYARLNIYQASENKYVLKDVYKTYLLDTNQKTLQETDASAYNSSQKFIGAFDYNDSGGWRYIPESERKETSSDSK